MLIIAGLGVETDRAPRRHVPTRTWPLESSVRVGERFASLLEELAMNHRGELVVLVGHGGATVDLLRTLYGDDYVRGAAAGILEQGVPHCPLTRLRLEKGRIMAVSVAVAPSDRAGA